MRGILVAVECGHLGLLTLSTQMYNLRVDEDAQSLEFV